MEKPDKRPALDQVNLAAGLPKHQLKEHVRELGSWRPAGKCTGCSAPECESPDPLLKRTASKKEDKESKLFGFFAFNNDDSVSEADSQRVIRYTIITACLVR